MENEDQVTAPAPEAQPVATSEVQTATPEVAVPEVAAAPQEEAPTHAPSLLSEAKSGEEAPKEEPKEEAPKDEADKADKSEKIEEAAAEKEADKAEEAPPEPIVYEDFKLPEGLEYKKEEFGEFSKFASENRFSQETAQKLVDMHVNAVQEMHKKALSSQWSVFNDTQKDWQTQVMADPVLGGAGHDTAMQRVAQVRDVAVPEDRREAFNQAMNVTGAGNHPEILRAFHTLWKYIRPSEPLSTAIKPPPDIGPKPKTVAQMMYSVKNELPGQ